MDSYTCMYQIIPVVHFQSGFPVFLGTGFFWRTANFLFRIAGHSLLDVRFSLRHGEVLFQNP